jgi:hypothetical protein
MNQDFEEQLRRALRPVEPSDGFTARVMRALPERGEPAVITPMAKRLPAQRRWQRFTTPAALAASLVLALLLGQQAALRQQQREQLAGEAARRELMQALRVTSQKLDLAYQAVQQPSPSPSGSAEENRS